MYKVMIVDDMDIIRRELKRMPIWGDRSGFEICAEARNGQEALDLLKLIHVDLVITDIRMPKIDGLELLQKINEGSLAKCVALLSDYTDFSYARQGLVLGAFDYLTKPADPDELKKLLGRVLENLDNRKRESERVRSIEMKLEEKVMTFFPDADVNHLVDLILAGDTGSSDLAARIADFSAASLDGDLIRTEFLLKGIVNEILHTVLGKKSWLSGFVDQNGILNSENLRAGDIEEMKRNFSGKIECLRSLISKLECSCTTDNEVVKRMCGCVLENADGEVSLKIVAEMLFMNRTYLSEVFRQKQGYSLSNI